MFILLEVIYLAIERYRNDHIAMGIVVLLSALGVGCSMYGITSTLKCRRCSGKKLVFEQNAFANTVERELDELRANHEKIRQRVVHKKPADHSYELTLPQNSSKVDISRPASLAKKPLVQ